MRGRRLYEGGRRSQVFNEPMERAVETRSLPNVMGRSRGRATHQHPYPAVRPGVVQRRFFHSNGGMLIRLFNVPSHSVATR